MAENPATETVEHVDDPSVPFDMGDTDLHFQKPEQPRNPDGTFAEKIPVTPAEQLAEPPAPAVKHPPHLVERATEFGLTHEEINDLSTSALDRVVWRMAKQQMKLQQDFGTARALDTNAVRVPTPEPKGTPASLLPAAAPADEFDWGIDESGQALTEASFHPTIARQMKASHAKIKALEEKLEASEKNQAARDARTSAQVIDAAFSKLGEGYQAVFGTDDLGEIPAASMTPEQTAAFKRRVFALQEAGIDLKNINRRTIVAKLKAAADLHFKPAAKASDSYAQAINGTPPPVTPAKRQPATISVEEWNRGAVAKPTARVGAKELKGDALAVQKLEQRMRENGQLLDPTSDAEIDDTLFE